MVNSFAQISTSSASGIFRSLSLLFDVSFYSTFINAAVVLGNRLKGHDPFFAAAG
jgi:hypothetical protein